MMTNAVLALQWCLPRPRRGQREGGGDEGKDESDSRLKAKSR